MSAHQFVAMWDCTGLECIVDITADEHRRMWEQLKGEFPSKSAVPNLLHLELRARYNSQRHYEIYVFNATDGITAEDIREMFDADPQTAADTIRRIGHKFYSDRREEHSIKIR
jgi:hypothetical protein